MPEPEEVTQRLGRVFEEYAKILSNMIDVSQQMSSKTQAAFKTAQKAFTDVNDVARMMGGSSVKDIKNYQAEMKKLETLQKALTKSAAKNTQTSAALNQQYIQTQTNLLTTKNAIQKYGESLRNVGVQNAAATVSFGNLFREVRTGIGDETVRGWKAKMASMVEPTKKAYLAAGLLAPRMKDMAASSTLGAAKFTMFAGGLSIFAGFLASTFMRALRGTVETQRTLLGTFKMQDISLSRSVELYGRMALAGDFWGVKQEEQIGLLNILSSSYAINAENQGKLTAAAGAAAVKALAFGKSLNMTAQQSSQAIATMKLFGVAFKDMPRSMINLKTQSNLAGLTISDLANIMTTLAPMSLTVANAHTKIIGVFAQMGGAIDRSLTDPMKRFIGTERDIRLTADAMQVFARAAAQMSLPEVLAFGGGLGFGGTTSLADAFEAAMAKTRPEIMVNMLRQVAKAIPGDRRDVMAGLATFISVQTKATEGQAARMAEKVLSIGETQERLSSESKEVQDRALNKQLEQFSVLSNAVQDPMERLIGIAQSLLTVVSTFTTKFIGGGLVGMLTGGPRSRP